MHMFNYKAAVSATGLYVYTLSAVPDQREVTYHVEMRTKSEDTETPLPDNRLVPDFRQPGR